MLKKKNSKITVIVMLILCLLSLQLQVTYADSFRDDIYFSASEDLRALDKIGLTQFGDIVKTEPVFMEGKGFNRYTIDCCGVLNHVVVLENDLEKITLNITDGDKTNIVELHADGEIVVDGKRVEIQRENESLGLEQDIPVTRAGASIYFKDNVSYGSATDYNYFLKNENISNINLHSKISNLAMDTLLLIMATAMGGPAGFAVSLGAIIYSNFVREAPNTTCLSCRSKLYTHKNYHSGYIPSLFTYIYKYSTVCYSGASYTGTAYAGVMYKYNVQG